MQLLYLDPRLLEPDPDGVREEPGDVAGLAATIAEQGLLQPLGVIAIGHERYRVVYGNRRRAAAIALGLAQIPCILLDTDTPHLLVQQLIENVQRQDLNDLEQARAFARLRAHLVESRGKAPDGELDDAVGQMVGLTGRTVRRYLSLLELPDEVQHLIRQGELNVTQAQHLRRIQNPRTQIELARAAAEEGMSAAEIGRLAAYFVANPNLTLETALQALEQGVHLRDQAGPEVSITGGPLVKTGGVALRESESDADLWDDADDLTDAGEYLSVADETIENQPRNKARVFRLRSLDQMVDETDRLTRAYVEGDLAKWIKQDDGAAFKLRLLLKQLESLTRGLRELVQQQGWDDE